MAAALSERDRSDPRMRTSTKAKSWELVLDRREHADCRVTRAAKRLMCRVNKGTRDVGLRRLEGRRVTGNHPTDQMLKQKQSRHGFSIAWAK